MAKDTMAERLERICASINKGEFGGEKHDAITWLGSREAVSIERFPSGSPKLDDALGGGWPKGRFVEIYGPESGGKTTLVLHALAEHQKKYPDEICALVDTEFSFDEEYAAALGVDIKHLIVHQPDSGQQALNIVGELMKQGVSCIVVDSVAALTTKEELESAIGNTQMGDQARLMSRSLRTLTGIAGSRRATVFWTNQMREKIGVMWGDKTTTPAGRALKHYASIRVRISAIGNEKDGDSIVSSKNKVDVKKNKTAPPFKTAEFCITFGHGIDHVAEVLDDAISLKVVEKRGAWLSFDGEQLSQGRSAGLDALRGDSELLRKIEDACVAAKESGVEPEKKQSVKRKTPKADLKSDPDAIDGESSEVESEGVLVQDV